MAKKLNDTLVKVINILNDGDYHDGNSIGDALSMSRSAVWKVIKKLQQYGVQIACVKGKGYQLQETLHLLDVNKIKSSLGRQGLTIDVFETIQSTSDYLRAMKSRRVCIAEQQTAGKGRLGRTWHSPFGKNIYLSLLHPFRKDISELAGLSMIVSLAIVKALRQYDMSSELGVKWPNDILYQQHKLAGILVEIQAESHGACHVIIGIGINVNMQDDHKQISKSWTSLRNILGSYIDRNELCAMMINQLQLYLDKFSKMGFSAFMQEWNAVDYLANRAITLKNINEQITGTVAGINHQGHLLLQLADGDVRAIASGDASVLTHQKFK